ncbi:MAG TPA: alanine racemase, partial [Myxococcota bacterium]|nr:alanine racemase [Myxococcota bacterium]
MEFPGTLVARIDLGALAANYALAKRLAGHRNVIAVLKADAYGHGAIPVARVLARAGCECLAVARVGEAAELRDGAVALPLLVLGGVQDAEEARTALALGATPVVHHEGHLALLREAARRRGARATVHVEVDTGMHRLGVSPETAAGFLAGVARDPNLRLQGVFTHLARADEADLEPSLEQLRTLRRVLGEAARREVVPTIVHAVNSAGLVAGELVAKELPEASAVRPGLMLYGVEPRPGTGSRPPPLRPVMTLAARIVQLRDLQPGEAVGYGATWRAPARTRVATLAVGYADGVPWSMANRGEVLLRGRRAPIVGRVSMDLLTVDAGAGPAAIGDEAIVFGNGLPVEEAAARAGTLPYELLTRVGTRVPRITLEGET